MKSCSAVPRTGTLASELQKIHADLGRAREITEQLREKISTSSQNRQHISPEATGSVAAVNVLVSWKKDDGDVSRVPLLKAPCAGVTTVRERNARRKNIRRRFPTEEYPRRERHGIVITAALMLGALFSATTIWTAPAEVKEQFASAQSFLSLFETQAGNPVARRGYLSGSNEPLVSDTGSGSNLVAAPPILQSRTDADSAAGVPIAERAQEELEKLTAMPPATEVFNALPNDSKLVTKDRGIQRGGSIGRTDSDAATPNEKWAGQIAELQAAAKRVGYNKHVQEQQGYLLELGFDLGQTHADGLKGKRTRQALAEFELLYVPVVGLNDALDGDDLTSVIKSFAELSRQDAEKFAINREVVAAIRLANMRTGVDFPYLMELAAAESSFDTMTEALKSSARGLFQFTEDTWLASIKENGARYGLGIYAAEIEYFVDYAGRERAIIDNPIIYQQLLELRFNPRYAALMAAEFTKDNEKTLYRALRREFGRTELYLAHFFGATDALQFLKELEDNPDRVARDIFPHAASSNPGVFHPFQSRPRTVGEVYAFFDEKFNLGLYESPNPLNLLVRENTQEPSEAPSSESVEETFKRPPSSS